MDIDVQWEKSLIYAEKSAWLNSISNRSNVLALRNNIFEYFRKRYLKLDYHEIKTPPEQYCFTCMAYLPKFHFC